SFHPEEVAGLVVPEFVGSSTAEEPWQGTYWGRNFFKGNLEYLGVCILLLALAGLAGKGRDRGGRMFFAGTGFVWLLFALGTHTPLWRVFYEVVPGISLFRVPSLAAFLVSFSVTTLFAFAVHDLTEGDPDEGWIRSAPGKVALGVVAILFLGLLLQAGGALTRVWTQVVFPTIDDRQRQVLDAATPFITRGFMIAVVFAGATTALAWAHQTRRLGTGLFVAGLGLLVALDLGRIDRPFIQTFDFLAWSAPDANDRFLQSRLGEEDPFRVIDFRDAQSVELAMHGLDLVTGHHPNDLARYRTLLGLQGSQSRAENWNHPVVLRILNTRYLLWPESLQGGPPGDIPRLSQAQGPYGLEAVYAYPGLGRAWFVGTYTVRDDEGALRRLLQEPFNPALEVILAEEPGIEAGGAAPVSTLTWTEYSPDERVLGLETNAGGFLVVSENWHPGWKAWVDGVEQPLLRANYTLGAVAIPRSGTYEIRLRYVAPQVRKWGVVSLVSLLTMAALCFTSLRRGKTEGAADA
ncbi:MAG: YfhO family protein, partial [Gemmatimonadota bacterium]|nr:YfhO family protein [Gemmatimonadota bacterium]